MFTRIQSGPCFTRGVFSMMTRPMAAARSSWDSALGHAGDRHQALGVRGQRAGGLGVVEVGRVGHVQRVRDGRLGGPGVRQAAVRASLLQVELAPELGRGKVLVLAVHVPPGGAPLGVEPHLAEAHRVAVDGGLVAGPLLHLGHLGPLPPGVAHGGEVTRRHQVHERARGVRGALPQLSPSRDSPSVPMIGRPLGPVAVMSWSAASSCSRPDAPPVWECSAADSRDTSSSTSSEAVPLGASGAPPTPSSCAADGSVAAARSARRAWRLGEQLGGDGRSPRGDVGRRGRGGHGLRFSCREGAAREWTLAESNAPTATWPTKSRRPDVTRRPGRW